MNKKTLTDAVSDKPSGAEPQWLIFREWASEQGIDLDDKDKWGPWWVCWVAAFKACGKLVAKAIRESYYLP